MGPVKVLLVDDDQDIAAFIKLKLSMEAPQFTFSFVDSGQACLDYLGEDKVDCILSDYQMPGMDGMDLLCAIREKGLDVPFIFLTGQGNEGLAREAFKNGAWDYFTKEIGFAHFARLINSIEQAVQNRAAEKERARAEEALRESEAKFRSLVEESLVGVYIIQDGRFAYSNPRLADIFGYTPEEITRGKTVEDLVAPSSRQTVMENIRKRVEGEIRSKHYVFRGLRSDGREIDVEVFGTRTVYGGRPAVIGTILDITERKKAEEADFFAMLAHDLKSPLAAISGYSEMIVAKAALLDDDTNEMAGAISTAAGKMARIIEDFLAASPGRQGPLP